MACHLGRAAECDDPALRRVSGERAHTSVVNGQQGQSGQTEQDRTCRELTGCSDSSVRDCVRLEIGHDEFCSCSSHITTGLSDNVYLKTMLVVTSTAEIAKVRLSTRLTK